MKKIKENMIELITSRGSNCLCDYDSNIPLLTDICRYCPVRISSKINIIEWNHGFECQRYFTNKEAYEITLNYFIKKYGEEKLAEELL